MFIMVWEIRTENSKLEEVKTPLRGTMLEKKATLSITRPRDFLSISRGLSYYRPARLTELNLKWLEKMDERFTENPT